MSHQISFFIALVAGVVLVSQVRPDARVASAVYMASLTSLFGVSALYHRPKWSPAARARMRKLDHASIFLLISGTYTPFCLMLPPDTGHLLLAVMWGAAALGVFRALFWINAPKPIVAVLALAMGWVAIAYRSEFARVLGPSNMVLLIAGGILYSAGALAYALKRPALWPRVFGYHELFHAFTIVAALCHFVIVCRILIP